MFKDGPTLKLDKDNQVLFTDEILISPGIGKISTFLSITLRA